MQNFFVLNSNSLHSQVISLGSLKCNRQSCCGIFLECNHCWSNRLIALQRPSKSQVLLIDMWFQTIKTLNMTMKAMSLGCYFYVSCSLLCEEEKLVTSCTPQKTCIQKLPLLICQTLSYIKRTTFVKSVALSRSLRHSYNKCPNKHIKWTTTIITSLASLWDSQEPEKIVGSIFDSSSVQPRASHTSLMSRLRATLPMHQS